MPVYEYECQKCGYVHEDMYKMDKEPKTLTITHYNAIKQLEEDKDIKCKGLLEKIISQSTFNLKGRGWFKDSYSSPKPDSKPKK